MEDKTPISIEVRDILFDLYDLSQFVKQAGQVDIKDMPHPLQISRMLFENHQESDFDMTVLILTTWLANPTMKNFMSHGTGDYIYKYTVENNWNKKQCLMIQKKAFIKYKNLIQEKKRYDKEYGKNTILF